MKVSSLVLGILGGLFGIGGAAFAGFVGGVGAAVGADGARGVISLGAWALLFSLAGLIAGALAMALPRLAGWTMIVCAIGGTISISWGYVVAGPLLLVAGILALVGARKAKQQAESSA